MQFELPHNHTTVMIGQIDLEQHATALIKGHVAMTKKADVLMLGSSLLTEHDDISNITFVQEEYDEIISRRYSLIVVNFPQQTVYHNGLVQIELPTGQGIVLNRLASIGIPFLAIVQ